MLRTRYGFKYRRGLDRAGAGMHLEPPIVGPLFVTVWGGPRGREINRGQWIKARNC